MKIYFYMFDENGSLHDEKKFNTTNIKKYDNIFSGYYFETLPVQHNQKKKRRVGCLSVFSINRITIGVALYNNCQANYIYSLKEFSENDKKHFSNLTIKRFCG